MLDYGQAGDFKKSEVGGIKIEPGNYKFNIVDASETTSKRGHTALAIKMEVYVEGEGGTTPVNVNDWVYFTEASGWRLKQFLLGLDRLEAPPTEATEYIGLGGTGKFVIGDSGFLEIGSYLTAGNGVAISDNSVPF
jgi:hypothetical protein